MVNTVVDKICQLVERNVTLSSQIYLDKKCNKHVAVDEMCENILTIAHLECIKLKVKHNVTITDDDYDILMYSNLLDVEYDEEDNRYYMFSITEELSSLPTYLTTFDTEEK